MPYPSEVVYHAETPDRGGYAPDRGGIPRRHADTPAREGYAIGVSITPQHNEDDTIGTPPSGDTIYLLHNSTGGAGITPTHRMGAGA